MLKRCKMKSWEGGGGLFLMQKRNLLTYLLLLFSLLNRQVFRCYFAGYRRHGLLRSRCLLPLLLARYIDHHSRHSTILILNPNQDVDLATELDLSSSWNYQHTTSSIHHRVVLLCKPWTAKVNMLTSCFCRLYNSSTPSMAVLISRSRNSFCDLPNWMAWGWKQQSKHGALLPLLSFSIWGGPSEYGSCQLVPSFVVSWEGFVIFSEETIFKNTFSLVEESSFTVFATKHGSGLNEEHNEAKLIEQSIAIYLLLLYYVKSFLLNQLFALWHFLVAF